MLEEDLSLLQKVPADAVFGYIEAKHNLTTASKKGEKASFPKALRQVHDVRRVLDSRPRVPLTELSPGIKLGAQLTATVGDGYPIHRNPSYVAIWARSHEAESNADFAAEVGTAIENGLVPPNLLIAGNVAMLPIVYENNAPKLRPHFVAADAEPAFVVNVSAPFGVAVAHLLFAIERVQLGELPWAQMLVEQVNTPEVETFYFERQAK